MFLQFVKQIYNLYKIYKTMEALHQWLSQGAMLLGQPRQV